MANYAHIENGEVTGVYDLLPENWRNVSNFFALESDTDTLQSLGWRVIQKTTLNYNPDSEFLSDPIYTIVDDTVVESFEVLTKPSSFVYVDPLAKHNEAMEKLRTQRDSLLQATDYTQLADVIAKNGPDLTTEFQTYRQLLRDLPATYQDDVTFVDVSTATFPAIPGAV